MQSSVGEVSGVEELGSLVGCHGLQVVGRRVPNPRRGVLVASGFIFSLHVPWECVLLIPD